MRLLVTRPREEAERFAEDLTSRGHEAVIASLLTIDIRHEDLDLDGVQALAFTSLNGVRAFVANSSERGLPVHTVGSRTAEAARAAGLKDVRSAAGDVDALAAQIATSRQAAAGAVLHVTGVHVAGDLSGKLSSQGFTVRRAVLYEARPVGRLPDSARTALQTGRLDGVTFFSPRTAASFARLVRASGLERSTESLTAFCLSPAVAAEARAVTWANVRVAAHPTQAALLTALAGSQQTAQEDAGMAQNGETPKKDQIEKGLKAEEAASATVSGRGEASKSEAEGATSESDPERLGERSVSGSAAGSTKGSAAEHVIARFGGLRPTATKLGVAVSTVQGWKARGHIPETRHDDLRAAAKTHGIEIGDIDLATTQEPATPETPTAGTSTPAIPLNPWAEPAGGDGGASPLRGNASSKVGGASKIESAPSSIEAAVDNRNQGRDIREDEDTGDDTTNEGGHHGREADAPAASRSGGLLLGLGLAIPIFVGGAIAAIYTRDYWEPFLPVSPDTSLQAEMTELGDRVASLEAAPPAVDPARLDDLSQRLDELAQQVAELPGEMGTREPLAGLQQRVDELAAQIETMSVTGGAGNGSSAPTSASPAAVSRLEDQIVGVRDELDELRGTLAETSAAAATAAGAAAEAATADAAALSELQTELTELRAELQEVESQAQQALTAGAGDSGLALALGQLRDALRFSTPFQTELQAIRSLIPTGDPVLELLPPLETHADRGVPTREELAARFEPMARSAVAASYDDSWSGRLMSRVSEAVSLRPVGEVEGDSARARVARADARLANDDLAGAVEALSGLQGPAAAEVATWMADAQARLAGEQALGALTRRSLARLAPAVGAPAANEQ
ncbi:uroporphyrinogen-III synthase [Algihabitans albus]|uniref:uroporphyrinogen-III synthase n=1 Tax=Algihabitans albus TaxID=2164067 RepID=UPI000E5CBFB0|nr:uroporphyrinogen-III synthase [Algihabitans albus]